MADNDFFGREPAARPLLSWHEGPWSALMGDPARLPHALLLSGRAGLGKERFAHRLAQALLCADPQPGGLPCGVCRGCRLFAAGTHPDLIAVLPAEAGRAITVDQIRELNAFLALRPHTAERKVVLISPADAMNVNAANSLLKSLEEPPLGSVLLLVTALPERLPATIRSRCATVRFESPDEATAAAWLAQQGVAQSEAGLLLALAGGAPLRALALRQENQLAMRETLLRDLEALRGGKGDVVTTAARWNELDAVRSLAWLQTMLADLIRLLAGGSAVSGLTNRDLAARLQALGKHIQLKALFAFFDEVSASRALLPGPLDEQLLVESLLISWARLAR